MENVQLKKQRDTQLSNKRLSCNNNSKNYSYEFELHQYRFNVLSKQLQRWITTAMVRTAHIMEYTGSIKS